MLKIKFKVATKQKKGDFRFVVAEDFPKELLGEYEIRELDAQEGINIENEFIATNTEAQADPDKQDLASGFQIKLLEAATTLNGKPFKMPELKTVTKRYYHLLVASFEKINGVTIQEERFLLQPSS